MSLNNGSLLLIEPSTITALKESRVAIVSTEWNDHIMVVMLEGCMKILNEHGAIITHELIVPGAVELPFACRAIATKSKEKPEAIIAFGAVIRGGTPHFDYVCESVVQGISTLNVTLDIPVIFGVLTLDTEAQAWERLGGKHGHKGEEAAITVLKMIAFNRQIAGTLPEI